MSAIVRAHRAPEHPVIRESSPLSLRESALVWLIVLGCMVLAWHVLAVLSGGAL